MFFSASSIDEYFKEINIPYDSEFLLVESGRMNAELSLTELYRNYPSGDLQRHRVANWSSSGGFIWSPTRMICRRGDLHGAVVRVGVPAEVSAGSFVINITNPGVCILNETF
jgi:hypothetical protein